jgi:TrmH family RNA methyltransferase
MPRLDRIRIVLVGPLYGGNVGSVCRAMANTGLSDLVLVAPPGLDMEEARKMAVSAGNILDARREVATLAEAVADCGLVMGATARIGLYRQHAASPRELAPRALEAAEQGPVALVFGREDKGLSNEEIALCTQLIRIPSHPGYVSLNLAQAVMVCAYEVFTATGLFEPPVEKSAEAPADLRERLFAIWREILLDIGFMNEDKADHMMLGLRRVWSRGKMTVDDVNILMGIARQMRWRSKHPSSPPAHPPAAD